MNFLIAYENFVGCYEILKNWIKNVKERPDSDQQCSSKSLVTYKLEAVKVNVKLSKLLKDCHREFNKLSEIWNSLGCI